MSDGWMMILWGEYDGMDGLAGIFSIGRLGCIAMALWWQVCVVWWPVAVLSRVSCTDLDNDATCLYRSSSLDVIPCRRQAACSPDGVVSLS